MEDWKRYRNCIEQALLNPLVSWKRNLGTERHQGTPSGELMNLLNHNKIGFLREITY